ncbi:MAG: aldose 1-epimerase family protein [Flavobacteriia bacterium]|nr:aldose 1-epimerase family protein [Flavobacteriia bacterium]
MYFLENDFIKLDISSLGAEIKSIFHKDSNINILYKGDTPYWNRSSPVLFPIVGKLKQNTYLYKNKEYVLSQHGFARDLEFSVIEKKVDEIIFELKSSSKTLEIYPFDFVLHIKYQLIDKQIVVQYKISNPSKEQMYFSIGAHPAFQIPISKEETFSDYYLEFPQDEYLKRYFINKNSGLFFGKSEQIKLNNHLLDLHYALFEEDALVIKKLKSTKILLKSKKNQYHLEFDRGNLEFLGLWTKKDAPFICIEPWEGLADSENHNQDFTLKEGIISLNPLEGKRFNFSFTIYPTSK